MASASEEEGDIEVDGGGGDDNDDDDSYLVGAFAEQGHPSHHFGPFSPANDSETEAASPVYAPPHYVDISGGDDDSLADHSVESPSGTPNYAGIAGAAGFVAGFSAGPHVDFSAETGRESLDAKDETFNEDFFTTSTTDGPVLPPPADMEPEEGFQLREWKRQNAIRLQEKEKRERELVIQIREEADEYKLDFHRRRQLDAETRKCNNREKEKLFLVNQEKFHAEAEKNYWKAVAELIPKEVPNIEKRRGKKEDKKAVVAVIHGPKPGKPSDLSRMRHILLKLKHTPPHNMKLPPPTTSVEIVPSNESKGSTATVSKD